MNIPSTETTAKLSLDSPPMFPGNLSPSCDVHPGDPQQRNVALSDHYEVDSSIIWDISKLVVATRTMVNDES